MYEKQTIIPARNCNDSLLYTDHREYIPTSWHARCVRYM